MAPIRVSADNARAVADADVVILAVKPQVMAEASDSIAPAVQANGALAISIAAGVTIASLQGRLGDDAAIVRCMPNTPALLGLAAPARFMATPGSVPRSAVMPRTFDPRRVCTCWVDREAGAGCHHCPVWQRPGLLFPVYGSDDRRRLRTGPGSRHRHLDDPANRPGRCPHGAGKRCRPGRVTPPGNQPGWHHRARSAEL